MLMDGVRGKVSVFSRCDHIRLERQWSLLDLEDGGADERLLLQRVPSTAQCAFGILSRCLRELILTGPFLGEGQAVISSAHRPGEASELGPPRVRHPEFGVALPASPNIARRTRGNCPGSASSRSQQIQGCSEQPLDLGFFVIRSKVRKHAQSVCSPKSEVTQRKQNLAESMGLRRQSGLWRLVARGAQSALLCDEFLSESVSRLRALPAPVRRLCSL
jgi:hypothetical protein